MELDGLSSTFYACLLWPWPLTFWSQNLTSTTINPNTYVTKLGWNSLHWFLRYVVHKIFGMHRLTHRLSWMDKPKNRMHSKVFRAGAIKVISTVHTKSRTHLRSSLILSIFFLTSRRKEKNVVYCLDKFQLNNAFY